MCRNYTVPTFPSSFSSRMESQLGDICQRCFMLLWICQCHMYYTISWHNAACSFNLVQTQGLVVSIGDPGHQTCKTYTRNKFWYGYLLPYFLKISLYRAKLFWIDIDIWVVHNVLWICLEANNRVDCCFCMWCTLYRLWAMAHSLRMCVWYESLESCVCFCMCACVCAYTHSHALSLIPKSGDGSTFG